MSDGEYGWQVGVSVKDITPEEPIWLHGWGGREKPADEASHPIYIKTAAFRDEAGETAVIVTSDLLGFSKEMSDAMADKVGLERRNLILNASHNHSGPCTNGVLPLYFKLTDDQYAVIDRYSDAMEQKLIESVKEAIGDLEPASLTYELGLCGFATNRRRQRDGMRHRAQVVDQDVPVLAARKPSGELKAVLFGYSCHTTSINDGKINGDYSGYAMTEVEQRNPGATAMYVCGCGGDQNPGPRLRDDLGIMYGKILGIAVDEVLGQDMRPVRGPLSTAFLNTTVPLQDPPTREQFEQRKEGLKDVWQWSIEYQIEKLDRGEELATSCEYPVHVWRFGDDLTFIGLTGENVVDYSLRFKADYGPDNTWVAGYNNELLAYVPSLRVLKEGSYEGVTGMLEYGHAAPFGFSVEEDIANAVDTLVKQTGGDACQDRAVGAE